MRGLRPSPLFLVVLLPVAVFAGGCASTQSTGGNPAALEAAIGTWRYQVTGIAPLDQGTFRIAVKDGRLQGIVRDRQRGRFKARVDVNDSRMELTVGRLHISGQIENGQFSGFLRLRKWDVSVSSRRRRSRSGSSTAPLYAERIRSGVAGDAVPALECTSILRETD
ncbi:MAG: hypothetical protein ABEL04_08090, partial [Salinibacter sp.]|uniref:hypothetical protein n=1 Tax=Salinibacter sp. TaxID=2065818 RepID=UPI0035D44032